MDVFEQLSWYSVKLYIDITASKSVALCIWVLFIPLMQLVNRAQFLNITFLSLLSGAAAVTVFGTVIVLLTSM